MQVKKKQFFYSGQVITYKWPVCLFFQENPGLMCIHGEKQFSSWRVWNASNKSNKACPLLPCFSPLILLYMHDVFRNILFSK